MNKFFAALMTLSIIVTVVVVFALGVLSVTGGVGESKSDTNRLSTPSNTYSGS